MQITPTTHYIKGRDQKVSDNKAAEGKHIKCTHTKLGGQ